ncbi:MAG: hypothetical protein HRT86_11515 [Ilumatobacteraceae bacterium]|nr:hypothetical protein [Ilumatobacteraceae bacterium]
MAKNIFEFVGLPADHRKKIFMAVKHFDDVNPKADLDIFHKKVSFPMFGQVKRDGCFAALVVTLYGEIAIYNRTGKVNTNTGCLLATYNELTLRPGIYLGEILSSHPCSLEELSGAISPNRKAALSTDKDGCNQVAVAACLYIDFFDHISLGEFERGRAERPYSERHAHCKSLPSFNDDTLTLLPYFTINGYTQLIEFADAMIEMGQEGAVFKQDVEWLCTAKDWHQMKIVRGIHLDLLCVGFEDGSGKDEGHISNLMFNYEDGKIVKCSPGRGWKYPARKELFEHAVANDDESPVGKIYHVAALQKSSKNGVLRLPKFRERRDDKDEPDF